ncbi:MAG: ABC transporter permease [Lachnospiraceae bacterium]
MIKLIFNELQKQNSKWTTKFLFFLCITAIIGIHYFVYVTQKNTTYVVYTNAKSWEENRNYYESIKEQDEYAAIFAEYYGYLLEQFPDGLPVDSWRLEAVDCAFGIGTYRIFPNDKEGNIEHSVKRKLLQFVEENDWQGYYQYLADWQRKNTSISETVNEEAVILFEKLAQFESDPEQFLWIQDLVHDYYEACLLLGNMEQTISSNAYIEWQYWTNQKEVARYRFEHQLENAIVLEDNMRIYPNNFWKKSDTIRNVLVLLITIFTVFLASNSIAGEFSAGTIKFLLIHPISRQKIFFSKYISLIIQGIRVSVIFFAVHLLCCGVLFDWEGFETLYITYEDGMIHTMPAIKLELMLYGISLIAVVIYIAMALMISSLIHNTGIAVVLSLVCIFGGNVLSQKIAAAGFSWGRYFLFSNTNLVDIMSGNPLFSYQTLTGAVITLVIYGFLFLLTAHDGFVRREMK